MNKNSIAFAPHYVRSGPNRPLEYEKEIGDSYQHNGNIGVIIDKDQTSYLVKFEYGTFCLGK